MLEIDGGKIWTVLYHSNSNALQNKNFILMILHVIKGMFRFATLYSTSILSIAIIVTNRTKTKKNQS